MMPIGKAKLVTCAIIQDKPRIMTIITTRRVRWMIVEHESCSSVIIIVAPTLLVPVYGVLIHLCPVLARRISVILDENVHSRPVIARVNYYADGVLIPSISFHIGQKMKNGVGMRVCVLAVCLVSALVAFGANAQEAHRLVVWDGEGANVGAAWVSPTSSTFQPQTAVAHSGNTALEFKFSGNNQWIGGGWGWYAFKTGEDVGADTTPFKTFSFWVNTAGKPVTFRLNFLCNGTVLDTPEHHSSRVDITDYVPDVFDGQWHEVRIPLKDLVNSPGFNARVVSQLQLDLSVGADVDDSIFIDDISFDDRPAS